MAAVLALLWLALASTPAAAQWQWRGKDGRMNISDRPPPSDVADKDIIKRPGTEPRRVAAAPAAGAASAPPAPAKAASAPMTALERDVQAKKRAAAQEQAAKAKAEEERAAAERATNCASARSYLATLDSGMRIARVNDKGEREVLDDTARNAEAKRARDAVASNCR